MDYSSFRSLISARLTDGMTVTQILACMDAVALDRFAPDPDALTMFLEAKAVEEKSSRTIKLYSSVLSGFFRSVPKPAAAVTTADVRHYLAQCKERGLRNVSIGNTRRILNCFFQWCVPEGLCAGNPVLRVSAIRQEKSPRHAMKRVELEYLRRACVSPREKALVDFLYSTGVRVSELCAARVDQIDWDRRTVLIEHGKGDVTRLTYLNPEAEVSLKAYLASRPISSPYIFARIRGSSASPLSPNAVQAAVSRIADRARCDFSVRITPHVFRHTIATVLLRGGMPVEQVQRFLGHANINTTMIYAQVRDEDVRRSHSLYAA